MVKTSKISVAETNSDSSPRTLAFLPLQGVVYLPGTVVSIFISRNVHVSSIDFALEQSRLIVLALQTGDEEAKPSKDNISRSATYGRIASAVHMPNGEWKVRLHVLGRVKIRSFASLNKTFKVRVDYVPAPTDFELSDEDEERIGTMKSKFGLLSEYEPELEDYMMEVDDLYEPGRLADLVASTLPLELDDSRQVLEEADPLKRLQLVYGFLANYVEVAAIKEQISNKAEAELARSDREILLREQLRQIQTELGEAHDLDQDLGDLKDQIKRSKMPAAAKKEAQKQLRRLQQLHPDTSEAALARTYLDWILDLPWTKRTKDRIDIPQAKKILDEEHFGLEKTKERILDFLGVRKLKKDLRGPILLLVGPPGVGKTSLGRSIATSLGRKFFRLSVGGLRDEAELRGHRRTYVGAMPGRIIQGLKTAGSKNPVVLLDEVDKVGADFRGDPASVLLEILDPEQNCTFEDHYLNIPFDLSEVMFIATANVTDTIPPALRDRMEIIEISGYTMQEKLQIADRYLVPQEKRENGLEDYKITFGEQALRALIERYTRESGVRDLRRQISSVFRKIARKIAEDGSGPKTVTDKLVEKLLGPATFLPDKRPKRDQVGVVMGLAWTPVGGESLTVEVAVTKGKGSLSLTGQLGDVMRESAMAALTYVQANAEKLGIDPSFYERSNVHIHVPEGAIPKDGPSAGIAIATALVSLLTNTPVSRNVAMTGEITLRGNVLAIGGLKEKALAALRMGIKVLVYPKEIERELAELPDYLLERITFVPVETIDEVLEVALVRDRVPPKKRKKSKSKDTVVRI